MLQETQTLDKTPLGAGEIRDPKRESCILCPSCMSFFASEGQRRPYWQIKVRRPNSKALSATTTLTQDELSRKAPSKTRSTSTFESCFALIGPFDPVSYTNLEATIALDQPYSPRPTHVRNLQGNPAVAPRFGLGFSAGLGHLMLPDSAQIQHFPACPADPGPCLKLSGFRAYNEGPMDADSLSGYQTTGIT